MRHYQRFTLEMITFFIISLCIPFSSFAGIENRPLNSDEAYIAEPMHGSVSVGVVYSEDDGNKEWSIVENATIGLFTRIEVSFDIPQIFNDPSGDSIQSGLGDIGIRPEIVLFKETDQIPQISFSETIKLETGDEDDGLGSGTTDFTHTLNLSKIWTPFSFHLNVGYTTVDGDGDDSFLWGLIGEYEATSSMLMIAEINGEVGIDSDNNDVALDTTLGSIFSLNDSWDWDIGINFGLTDAANDVVATTGITYSF